MARHSERALAAGACTLLLVLAAGRIRGADQAPPKAPPVFEQYCFDCHGNGLSTAGVSLEKLTSGAPVAENYLVWQRVITALSTHRMPPVGNPQPPDEERQQAVAWIKAQLDAYTKAHGGEPGRVTVRRLTSGEYAYTVHDLTGLDLDLGIDASTDSVGGEGFTNFGDVQFMQQNLLELRLQVTVREESFPSTCDATGTDAAFSKERLDGFLAMAAALTARYSAYAPIPVVVPNTAPPGAHAATSLPICSTTPENS